MLLSGSILFFKRDGRNRDAITSSLSASIGALLTAPASFRRAFTRRGASPIDLGQILDGGGVVIIDIDLDAHSTAGALAYAFLFSQFKQFMGDRLKRLRDPHERLNHVGLVADEYPRVARADDLRMFQLAREAQIASLIAIQTMTGLEQTIGKSAAEGIAHALGTTILLPGTGDPASLALISLGQVDREIESYSKNVGISRSGAAAFGSINDLSESLSNSSGESWSTSIQQQQVIDPQVYASLRRHLGKQYPADDQWTDMVIRTFQPRIRNGVQTHGEAAEIIWRTGWQPSPSITAPEGTALREVLDNKPRAAIPVTPVVTALPAPRESLW